MYHGGWFGGKDSFEPFPATNMSGMAIIITQITRKITPYLQKTYYGGVRFGNHNTLDTHPQLTFKNPVHLRKPTILVKIVFTVNLTIMQP